MTVFQKPGNWYKGNLHTHSTNSDGLYTPEMVCLWYWTTGYDFLSITDHRSLTLFDEPPTRSPVLIPGMELNGDDTRAGGGYHIVGLGLRDMLVQPPDLDAQGAIDAIRADGGLAVLAHPYWLGHVTTDLTHLEGATGLEVFNYGTQLSINKGDSTYLWDGLLDRKRPLFGLAVDDAHWKLPDAGGGWVMAKAESCTSETILDAIGSGDFYSSQGPEIYDFRLEDGVASAKTSPVRTIAFMSERSHGQAIRSPQGDPITSAHYSLRNEHTYLRLECVDFQGRRAWSNPISLEGDA
ncbi:MAG: CehA/McbA family metallohydrolase [Chloroflexi bacterium]|nr:CehA/McbA family metallohydrolase [Chloroflexota bacterium]